MTETFYFTGMISAGGIWFAAQRFIQVLCQSCIYSISHLPTIDTSVLGIKIYTSDIDPGMCTPRLGPGEPAASTQTWPQHLGNVEVDFGD